MEILKLKITVTKIKISVDGLNSIIEGRGKNQWPWRWNKKNYPFWTTKGNKLKKKKRMEPQGPVVITEYLTLIWLES